MKVPDIDKAGKEADVLSLESLSDASPSTKLERRRRIEDILEEKQLKREMDEFELG